MLNENQKPEIENRVEKAKQLSVALEDFTAFVREAFADGMGDDFENPTDFIAHCMEAWIDFKDDEKDE